MDSLTDICKINRLLNWFQKYENELNHGSENRSLDDCQDPAADLTDVDEDILEIEIESEEDDQENDKKIRGTEEEEEGSEDDSNEEEEEASQEMGALVLSIFVASS